MSLPDPHWLHESQLQQLFAAVRAAGGEMRAVGGCVRDHLLGIAGADVDCATSLAPEIIIELVAAHGWKAKPTGIAHGTVTVILPTRVVEVTTLRRDVATDGRHATVAYTDRFEEDAARRDFTINALYMDAKGTITDYHGGRDDIAHKRLRFIGDATARVQEDGLRILRYFRFLATLGWHGQDTALTACKAEISMIAQLSGERIQQEMKKLLAAANPADALAQMAAIGLAELLTVHPWNVAALARLAQHDALQQSGIIVWLRLMAMIAPSQRLSVADAVASRWKLSRKDYAALGYLARSTDPSPGEMKESLRVGIAPDWVIAQLALHAGKNAEATEQMAWAQSWKPPQFPVTAKDLLAHGMREGAELGKILKVLEQRWVQSDYTLSKAALLATI